MKLDHSTVHTARAIVQWFLRVCSVVLVVWVIVLIGNRVLFGVLGSGYLSAAWKVWMNTGEQQGIFLGLPMLLVGAGLGFFSSGLARWMVRPPARGCARCGYETLDDQGRCSECGYR